MGDFFPVLISKTKLKSLSFATNISSIYKNFELNESKNLDFNQPLSFTNSDEVAKVIEKESKPSGDAKVSNKRARTESLNASVNNIEDKSHKENVNKKMCIDLKDSEVVHYSKPKKQSFSDNNYRRLNMKKFQSKGKQGGFGNNKGAKYKKFLWKKNKNFNKANAKYGVGISRDDEALDTFNYNLIGEVSPGKKEAEKKEEDVLDEMSTEAIFSRLKKSEPKKSILKAKEKTPEKKIETEKSDKENENEIDEKLKSKPKKSSTASNKKEKKQTESKKSISKKILNSSENDSENDEENFEKKEKSKSKPKPKPKSKQSTSTSPKTKTKSKPKKSKKSNASNPEEIHENEQNDVDKNLDQDEEEEDNYLTNYDFNETGEIKPLFPVDQDGNVPKKLPDYAYKILEKDFGHKKFKNNQEETIIRIACGLSSLAILSTGYGKSLIYQFAALLYAKRYPGSTVLVVSPLISLMQDQVHNLSRSLKAGTCDSQTTDKDYELLVQNLNQGKINILYLSPEAIINKKIKSIPRLAFVCIDEVHCLSQWSHNFRPSYLQLCQVLFGFYNAKCILGLTATATHSTIEEIRSYFDIDRRNIIKDSDLPDNLLISVSKDTNKEKALIELLKSKQYTPYFNHVIIYCSRREQTERLSHLLRLSFQSHKKSFDLDKYATQERKQKGAKKSKSKDDEFDENNIAEAYHAGLTGPQRKRIQNQFIKGKLKIIVATMAFGMGINMPNIRAVIHYNMPKSIENYVQEIGRAGRDGKLSWCYLFLETQREDINEIKKYIHMNGYDQLTIKRLILKIFYCCNSETCCTIDKDCSTSAGKDAMFKHHVALPIPEMVEYLDVKEETVQTLLCYLESAQYVRIMSNCYKSCVIKSYKGMDYLSQLAKTNDLVALILKQNNTTSLSSLSELNVDVIELCEKTNCNYDVIRQKLKRIEWQCDEAGNFRSKSGLNVQFSNPSFYVKRRCIFDETLLDNVNDMLWNRVTSQMQFSDANFKALYKMLNESSFENINESVESFIADDNCLESQIDESKNQILDRDTDLGEQDSSLFQTKTPKDQVQLRSISLKKNLNNYFNNKLNIDEYTKDYDFDCDKYSNNATKEQELTRLITDIKRFVYTYQTEAKLNGLIIARIFHGIGTPRFPNEVWGRNRQFWRSHLDFDFEKLVKIATEQLLSM